METKQLSLTLPNSLYNKSKEYVKECGYRNVQDLVLDLLRQKVVIEKIQRYQKIENELKNKKGMNKEEAAKFLEGL